MIVVINGQPRSGSTLAFNIVRLIALAKGRLRQSSGTNPPALDRWIANEAVAGKQIDLFKCHYWVPRSTGIGLSLIYTYRNPLDVIASSVRVPDKRHVFEASGYDPFIAGLHYDYSHYCAMQMLASADYNQWLLQIRYFEMHADPLNTVGRIAKHLGIRLSEGAAASIVDELAVDRMKNLADNVDVDEATQIRRGHISETMGVPGAWRTLPAEIVRRIREEFRFWIEDQWPYLMED